MEPEERRRSVLVVGEALVDVVAAKGRPPVAHAGGSPLNVAVGLARLGVPTTFGSQVGADDHGEEVARHLRGSGAALAPLPPRPTRTSTARATLTDDGAASYEFDVVWGPSTLPELGPFAALHVGSLATVVRPGADRVRELAAAASARGMPVSYDPNVRLAAEPDPDAWRRAFAEVLPHAAVVKLSDEDAAVLAPSAAAPDLAADLARAGRVVIVTCGGSGAWLATSAASTRVAAGAGPVVDTIGAGDSFMSAVVAWLTRRRWPAPDLLGAAELAELGSYASAAAAVTCSRPGADPPWADELPGG